MAKSFPILAHLVVTAMLLIPPTILCAGGDTGVTDVTGVTVPGDSKAPGRAKVRRGQHGGDLDWLRSFHAVVGEGSSGNHIFDLWEPGGMETFVRVQGLTNNRALIIDSHGSERQTWRGLHYVFRPKAALLDPGREVPAYSIRDIAQVMGPAAADIHNIVIAGCNEKGALKAATIRQYFVNATNISHMAAGHLSYKPIFYQVLTVHSANIQPLFGRTVWKDSRTDPQGVRVEIFRQPVEGAVPLGVYVADLFEPGGRLIRSQLAGRELLDPSFPAASSASVQIPDSAADSAGAAPAQAADD